MFYRETAFGITIFKMAAILSRPEKNDYKMVNKVVGGILVSLCPSALSSICPSVPHVVSVLWLGDNVTNFLDMWH